MGIMNAIQQNVTNQPQPGFNVPQPQLPSRIEFNPSEIARQAEQSRRAFEEQLAREAEWARQQEESLRKQAWEQARALEAQRQRIQELRDRAADIVGDFERRKDEAQQTLKRVKELHDLAQSRDSEQMRIAIEQLRKYGRMSTNQRGVQKTINDRFFVVVWSKEFDQVEEVRFAQALGASVATANPAPAIQYVTQFAAESKRTVVENLRKAPDAVRTKLEREFEQLLVKGLDAAINGKRPAMVKVKAVDIVINVATYNHEFVVELVDPRLVKTGEVLGVPVYTIEAESRTIRIPMPNTFQPYVGLVVQVD